jgi:hypothetical protein
MLQTESHGEVEAGFFSIFTQFARLDDYAFATRHICKLLRQFAEDPTVRQGRLLSYSLEKFWQRQAEFFQHTMEILLGQLMTADTQGRPPTAVQYSEENQERIARLQSDISMEDDIDLYNEGTVIPVQISDDGSMVSVGAYQIAAPHFSRMAVYLAHGGIVGWMADRKPDFAEPTLQSIRASHHPIYEDAKRPRKSH